MGRLRERSGQVADGDVQLRAVALLFAQPLEPAIKAAAQQTDYFDARTGSLWDLFFAGYYRYGHSYYDDAGEPLTDDDVGAWFSPREFNRFRHEVETRSEERWVYSGGIDLVLVNGFLMADAEPIVDWVSAVGRPLVDANGHYRDLSLGGAIEAISRGIEKGYESQDWNLPSAADVRQDHSAIAGIAREVFAGVITGVLTSVM